MASAKLASAMREVHTNIPKNVKKTGKTGAAKESMLRAIAFSKARAAGANIPKKGGNDTIAADSMKYQALSFGRKNNLAEKAAFKTGPIIRDNSNGGSSKRTDTAAAEEVCDGR